MLGHIISKMTYNVSSGMSNPAVTNGMLLLCIQLLKKVHFIVKCLSNIVMQFFLLMAVTAVVFVIIHLFISSLAACHKK